MTEAPGKLITPAPSVSVHPQGTSPRTVVVTGATGFVGANLTRRLLADGHEVHLLVRPDHHTWRIDEISHEVQIHYASLEDAEGVCRAVSLARPDWVFNLAAHGAYSWQTDLREMLSTNIVGTVNLLEAATRTGFEAFIHAGSSSEYGVKDHSPAETEWLEPNSHYAVTKASASLFCRFAAQRDGLGVRVLRLYSVFGPWEEPNRLMPTLVLRGLAGELPPLVSATTARDYVFTDDAIDAFVLAAETPDQEPGAIYNVGTGQQTSLAEVVSIVKRQVPIDAEPNWTSMSPRHWDTEVWIADPRRINTQLGWQPRHTVEAGLQVLIAWIRDNPHIREFYETCTEIGA